MQRPSMKLLRLIEVEAAWLAAMPTRSASYRGRPEGHQTQEAAECLECGAAGEQPRALRGAWCLVPMIGMVAPASLVTVMRSCQSARCDSPRDHEETSTPASGSASAQKFRSGRRTRSRSSTMDALASEDVGKRSAAAMVPTASRPGRSDPHQPARGSVGNVASAGLRARCQTVVTLRLFLGYL